MKIAIIGLGYVGLPLALRFAEKGVAVFGIDTDPKKPALLNQGKSYLRHFRFRNLKSLLRDGMFSATCDFQCVRGVDAVIICVPTPLGRHHEPNLEYILESGKSIAPYIGKGCLVMLESTSYPGTTIGELRPVLESGSGLVAGRDFHLGFSPEREDPGNRLNHIGNIPKIVGGYTPRCLEKATNLYKRAVAEVVPVSSCDVAEATKLLENIFRCVNIALVNELKMVYSEMGIDIWEVIAAARTKPFGFMAFYPGPGLGGHCIPIDPFYLTWKAREFGQHTRFIELAGQINKAMPSYVVSKVVRALNACGKSVSGSSILVLGLAYKGNIDDDRESPSYDIIGLLERQGANVEYNDPFIPVIPMTREHSDIAGRRSKPIEDKYDAIVVATDHKAYRSFNFSKYIACIIDTRNCVAKRPRQYYKA